jgi:hypothetical protein
MTRPGDRPPSSRGIPKPKEQGPDPKVVGAAGLGAALGGLLFWRSRKQSDGSPRRRRLTEDEESLMEGHELRDMRVRQVVRWLALLTVAVTGLIILVTLFERGVIGHVGPLQPVLDVVPQATPPPQPRLELENGEILSALHAQENQVLNNYTWIDQAAGTVSLPIDRAIELTAQRGLPVQSQPSGGSSTSGQATPGVTLPEGSNSGRTLERIP